MTLKDTLHDGAETFRLGDNCEGVVWEDTLGWHGCLSWGPDLPQTDFIGPCLNRREVTRELRELYALNYRETTD